MKRKRDRSMSSIAVNTQQTQFHQRFQAFLQKLKELDLELIAHQLIQSGWTYQQTTWAINRYKMFLSLIYLYPHTPLIPTQEIDFVWHCHILHTRKYSKDCQMLFGYFIHHEPSLELWGHVDQLTLEANFAHTETLFKYYFPKATLENSRLEQLDRFFLLEDPLQQKKLGEKENWHFYRSACGRPI